jgi:hypothetical protein
MQTYWGNRGMVPLFNLGTKWKLDKTKNPDEMWPKKSNVLRYNTVVSGGKIDARIRNYKPHI